MPEAIDLCASAELEEGGLAVSFDVDHRGQIHRAFAVRFQGRPHAYLNRCTHWPIEMDVQIGRFFDDSGQWLLCATHGAAYSPDTGVCEGGPCTANLVKLALHEANGHVYWEPTDDLRPVSFD